MPMKNTLSKSGGLGSKEFVSSWVKSFDDYFIWWHESLKYESDWLCGKPVGGIKHVPRSVDNKVATQEDSFRS